MRLRYGLMALLLVGMLVACAGQATPTRQPTAPPQVTVEQVTPTPTPTPTPRPQPTPTPTPKPSPTPTPEQVEAGGPFSALLPQSAEGVRDYRLRYVHAIRFEGAALRDIGEQYPEEVPLWEATIEATVDPPARHIVMRGLFASFLAIFTGTAPEEKEAFPEVEMIQIGEKMWINTPQGWILFTQQAEYDPESDLQDFQQSLSISGWQRVGSEQVNGFQTDHYRVEISSSSEETEALPGFLDMLQQFGAAEYDFRLERIVGDAYVTSDGLLVKAELEQQWHVAAQGEEGRWIEKFTFELEGVNLGITIEPPTTEEVEEPVPVPPGAVRTGVFGPTRTYQVADMTLQEVVAFYQDALPANGFTIEQSLNNGQLLTVSKGGKRYTILIGPLGGNVNIAITEQP